MPERFTDRLARRAAPIWEAQFRHPFVQGIGSGTLDVDKFKFWVRQDYVFLIEYARLLGLAQFGDFLQSTLKVEMDLHRSYAAEFNISLEELEREEKAPTTQGYTDFLVRTAATGDFAELVAALLPCMWGFCDMGRRLLEQGRPQEPRYALFVDMYSSQEFADVAQWCRDLLDRLAEGLPEAELARLETAFVTSSRYEYLFWEMAYRGEGWPA
jgi:thiaminase/transcriptional activator TenA